MWGLSVFCCPLMKASNKKRSSMSFGSALQSNVALGDCPHCGARHMSPYKSEDVEESDDE
jgi:hypothetical protein